MKKIHSKKYTYETRKDEIICWRDGEPSMVALICPEPEDKDFKNVVVLRRVSKINPSVLDFLFGH